MGYDVEECLVIEDTITGVQAAKSGGFDVFGFAAHNLDEDFQNKTTKVFHTMEELLPMIY